MSADRGLAGTREGPGRPLLAACLLLFLLLPLWGAIGGGANAQDTALPSETRPAPRYEPVRGLSDWFQRGGIFMIPLLACSIFGLGIVMERFVGLRRLGARVRPEIEGVLGALEDGGVDDARAFCRRSGGPVARVLHAGLARSGQGVAQVERALEAAGSLEVAFLKRGLLWLATIANIAPLLGFLGTVSGMIHAFATIAGADQISAKLVASGIEEALITTEAGLVIAIPVQAFHNYFVGRVDRFITDIEAGSLELLAALERRASR